MNILILTRWLPYPPVSGNPIRNFNLFRRIAKVHNISLFSYADPVNDRESIEKLEQEIGPVTVVPEQEKQALDHPLQMLRYLYSGIPVDLRHYQSAEIKKSLQDVLTRNHFDMVQIEDSFLALHWNNLTPDLQSRSILTFHDVAFKKYQRMYPLEPSLSRKFRLWLHSKMMHRWEPRFAGNFSMSITMSELDRQLLLSENPRLRIATIPNGVDTRALVPAPLKKSSSRRLIFVGNMGYRPNVDGAKFFIHEILPLIRKSVPEVELWLVGIHPSDELLRLASPYIHVTGEVENVVPYYNQSDICVVPLRAGSGTRLKILESMALGRPVVSTSIGCEGLELTSDHIVIEDNPVEFARQVINLLEDNDRYQDLARNARRLVEEKYDWDVIAKALLELYTQVEERPSEK